MLSKKCVLLTMILISGLQAADRIEIKSSLYDNPAELERTINQYPKEALKEVVNLPDKYGVRLLMRFVGYQPQLKILLHAGADPYLKYNGMDVLSMTFKKAYIFPRNISGIGHEYSTCLNILKQEMNIYDEACVFERALQQGMKLNEYELDELQSNVALIKGGRYQGENRDFKMIYNLIKAHIDNNLPEFDSIPPAKTRYPGID